MSGTEHLCNTFESVAKAMTENPSLGLGTGISKTRVNAGSLRCEITEGKWQLAADMSEAGGGFGSAPTPGVLGRAALGSCLAITYTMYAAKLGLPLEHLEVEIQADYDDGAFFGVSDAPAGFSEIRYTVNVASPASESEIIRVLDEADAHCPYLDVFRRAQSCRRLVNRVS